MTYETLNSEGTAHAQNNRPLDAKRCFEQAIALAPNEAAPHSNLGIVLSSLGEADAAIDAFQHAIALNPSYKTAYLNLALTQLELGKNGLAADNFLKVLVLEPASFQALYMMSIAYFQNKQFHLALDAVDRALALQPRNMEALHNKSSILTSMGKQDQSIAVLQQMLQIEPLHEAARFHLAKYGHADSPSTAPTSYITDLFDQYAAKFDEELTGKLGYLAPEKISAIVRGLGLTSSDIRALDLGCGTGLVAAELADLPMHWVGVDLSQKMLSAAAKKAHYAELYCSSIEEYLEQPRQAFNLITAADVFIYVGELTSTFKLACQHLNDNGWFVFSVEKSEQQPLTLRPSGRFAHSETYISELAAQFGLAVQTVAPLTLRFEGSTPVEGLVIALQKI